MEDGVRDWVGGSNEARDKGTHAHARKQAGRFNLSHSLGMLSPLLGMGEEQMSKVHG